MQTTGPIKVLLVDDSALVRSMFQRVLSQAPDIEVVGGAKDPFEAREMIIAHRPAVIILDVEMPRMDGITFLKKLRAHYPVPVIMCSGVTQSNSQTALDAIEAGAIDVIAKPSAGGSQALRRLGEDLIEKIQAAAIASPAIPPVPNKVAAEPSSYRKAGLDPGRYIVAIGASTGGTEAIANVLRHVPADFPPVAIVQHMPEGFTRSFAERLNSLSRMSVKEAADGDVLEQGRAFIARGGVQMTVQASGGRLRLRQGSSEPVNRHCPAVDVLFDSVAQHAARSAVGVLLTGMGADGAKGLLAMRQAGAVTTIAQDKRSCVVYGMPKVATDLGAAEQIGPPQEVPGLIFRAIERQKSARRSVAAR